LAAIDWCSPPGTALGFVAPWTGHRSGGEKHKYFCGQQTQGSRRECD
jgi:hypothetical protein